MRQEKAALSFHGNRIFFSGALLTWQVSRFLRDVRARLKDFRGSDIIVDLSELEEIDTAGVALINEIRQIAKRNEIECRVQNASRNIKRAMKIFSLPDIYEGEGEFKKEKYTIFEGIGDWLVSIAANIKYFFYLLSDTIFYSFNGFFKRHGMRKGEFINQSILIGMNALPIVGLISFLIGFILALQSAAQLRQFGANIYVADLVAISMTREMGPIMTAIVLAGRSGSAIASEIATMVVTEETDALKSMGLNPIRYVLVPKVYAITVSAPMLTILSMLIGIFGSLVIGITYLGIGIEPFYNEVINALILKDIITGIIKSLVFAWIIVMIGAYYGFRVKGGAENVGRVTTSSVVVSIFLVILADSLLGLFFYFGGGIGY